MEGYPFKRLSHNDDSNGLSCFANDNGKKSQYAFKGRTNSSKTGGSIIFESWRWKGTICIIIACFLAVDFMLQGKITTLLRHYDTADSGKKPDPLVLELKALRFVPNLTEILDSGDRVKFVPHKLIEKFREKNGGTNSTSDMEQRKPIPIKAPQLALMGAKTDCKFSLGAWTWDKASGEELHVRASLAKPYNEAWCSVEYYEAKGEILKMLLRYISPYSEHHGRTLICHAVLCRNSGAINVLLDEGENAKFFVRTNNGHEFFPLHMTTRMGCLPIVKQFIKHGCDLNARTEMGETALMLCARANHHECFMELLAVGTDLGLLNRAGQSVVSIAEDSGFESCVHQVLCATIKEEKKIKSSDLQVFSCLHFVARFGDAMVLQKLLE